MEKRPLREMLRELHAELERTDSVDTPSQELLAHVMEDIRDVLERSEDETHAPHPTLAGRLREATRYFEESHPTLTAMMGRVADTLSNLGI